MDLIRKDLDMSVGRWKALLVAFALLSITAMGTEFLSAVATFERGIEGLWGVKRDRVMRDGQAAFVVREFAPWSLAPQSGLQVGDTFIPDHWYDVGRSFAPSESIGGTIVRDGASLRAEVTTTPRPVERIERLFFFLNAGLCSLGILISLAIGFRQPDRKSSRALALAFLWFSTNLGADYAPPQWPLVYARVMNDTAFVPGWYFLLWFAIHYPDGIPTGWRRGLRRVLPLFLIGAVVGTAMHVASALGRIAPDAAGTAYLVYVGVAGPLTLVAFWDGWRRSSGVSRQRFTWLLGGFALFFVVSYSTWVNWLVIDASEHYVKLASVLGSLAMYVGLSYAILRHRVLDMGLALNRSLVFAVVGAVLLGTFQLLQVVTARLLHFDDPAKAGLLSGVLAVLVMLAYPKVKPRAEWLIDRLFFRDWVAREADLASFTADARGFTEASSLAAALVSAIDRFTARAGATLYVRASDGRFERQQSPSAGPQTAAPSVLDADEPLAVALRAGRSVARCDEVHSTLPSEMAMVLSRQRELEAFILIGRRHDGSVLRSDEVAALRATLHSVGVERQALRWESLQRERVRACDPAP
ncbi:MAG: hypothetical protein IPI87_04455 [Betaproteobacteria bacterium]|nr:hypothetical protein [Betaproteobacteria bacterium]